jgi:hypothetical protein
MPTKYPAIKGLAAPRSLSNGQRPSTQHRPPLSDRNSLKNKLNVMKDRSLCQVKKATRYKRRIKPVLEDNDCQMKSGIIRKINQSMIGGRTNLFYLPQYFRKRKGRIERKR